MINLTQTIVVKLSGKLTETAEARARILSQIKTLRERGSWVVVVHGGGKQLDELASQTGVARHIVNGRRVTCAKTLELAKMAFMGSINTDIVAQCYQLGFSALGICGASGGIVRADKRPPQMLHVDNAPEQTSVDFGFVGDLTGINVAALYQLMMLNHVPVIAPLAIDASGQLLNVNADTVAGEIAVACDAQHLVMLGDTDGIYADRTDNDSLIGHLDIGDIDELVASRKVDGGMLPKLAACRNIVSRAQTKVHLTNGFTDNAILQSLGASPTRSTIITANHGDTRRASL